MKKHIFEMHLITGAVSHLHNKTCYVELEDIKKPVPIFLSDNGKHVYLVLKTGVYRTLVYVSNGQDRFFFHTKTKTKRLHA